MILAQQPVASTGEKKKKYYLFRRLSLLFPNSSILLFEYFFFYLKACLKYIKYTALTVAQKKCFVEAIN